MSIQQPKFEQLTMTREDLEFSALSCGFSENPQGSLVICLHGFPDSARTFRLQLPALAKAGYRVIAPTLRGYEPSSQPSNQDYSVLSLGEDIVAWIDHLGEQQAHLIGHDWGGVIACVAGAQAPERFCSLTIIAAPHIARATAIIRYVPRQMLLSWYIMFFQLRGISAAAVRRNNWSLLRKLWKNWAPGYQLPEAEWELMLKQFDQPGVLKAALSYYRQNASPGVFLGWRHLGLRPLQSIPVRSLVIAGIDDGCFDQRIYDYVFSRNDFPEALRVVKIDGVGHFPHQEAPQQINSIILDWLG